MDSRAIADGLRRFHRDASQRDLSSQVRRLFSDPTVQPKEVMSFLDPGEPVGEVCRRILSTLETERRAREDRQSEERLLREAAVRLRIAVVLATDFLGANTLFNADPDRNLIGVDGYERLKAEFVKEWSKRELKQDLDSEQAAAVAATDGDVLVVARAGSGKTLTLVIRAVFLIRHCLVRPHEILLLAFNKKAQAEIRERLNARLGNACPHVMTFHSLAYALVQPRETIIYDTPDADQFGLSREVQDVIDEHVRSEEFGSIIRQLMLAHFRDDWERIVNGRYQLTMEELLAYRRQLPRESLKGHYVKSFGEKIIANALFEHGVAYSYEKSRRWNGVNYKPDFTIETGPNQGVVIEYFGLQGDADYDADSAKKRAYWAHELSWTFLEFKRGDIESCGEETFVEFLLGRLREAGIPCTRLTEEDIWQLVRERALDKFTGAMETFIGRCRSRGLAAEHLERLIRTHNACSESEQLFLDIGLSVYKGYLQRLATGGNEDFPGLMWRATRKIRNGETSMRRGKYPSGDLRALRFAMIDEFQDFSLMFMELINAVRGQNTRVQFTCVGDDWQAINGFAGADLDYYSRFEHHFRSTRQLYLTTNYRSSRDIVRTGNTLMRSGGGKPARPKRDEPGVVWECDVAAFQPSAVEHNVHGYDEITAALLRIIRNRLDNGQNVLMLSRRNRIGWHVNYRRAADGQRNRLDRFLSHVQSFLPERDRQRVKISSAHKSKGAECDSVVILDAVARSYPLIHPNWVFLRVFGDSVQRIEEEERRLFYVALTRAKHAVAVITESPQASPYIADIRKHTSLLALSWNDLAPAQSLSHAKVEVRVSNSNNAADTMSIKDALKALGYRYDREGRSWRLALPAEGFSFDTILESDWVHPGVTIEAYAETGLLLHERLGRRVATNSKTP